MQRQISTWVVGTITRWAKSFSIARSVTCSTYPAAAVIAVNNDRVMSEHDWQKKNRHDGGREQWKFNGKSRQRDRRRLRAKVSGERR
jgi:hypothetical protein